MQCARCTIALPALTEAPAEQPDAEITQLRALTGNRYRILRRLGSGGMAHVYVAEHVQLGSPVVIKVLHAQLAREAEMRERFRREAEAAAHLGHPFICPILDYGMSDEVVYLVMRYLPGGSLADRLVQDRTVPPAFAATTAAQVACEREIWEAAMSSIAFVILRVDCTDLIRRRRIRSCPPAIAPPFSLVLC